MSERSRRPSTIKASKSQLERSKTRKEISQSKKISGKLKQIIQSEEAEFDKSAVELTTLAENIAEDTAPPGLYLETGANFHQPGTFPTATNLPEQPGVVPVATTVEGGTDNTSGTDSDDEQYEDPLHAVRTPTKVTSEGTEENPVFEN